jgi:hypothetical protein
MVLPSRAIISQKHSIKLLPACLAEEQFSEADLNNFMKNKYNTFFYIPSSYKTIVTRGLMVAGFTTTYAISAYHH